MVIIKACKWFMLYIPVIKIFYEENDFGDFELFLLHAIYSVVIACVEVPSGYIADLWGRKKALTIGMLLATLGFASYSFSSGFWGFLVAEIALGIGQAFVSGTDSALLYDTLKWKGKQNKYLKLEGQITGIGNICEASAGIMVTVLSFSLMRHYFQLQSMISLIGLMAAIFLIDPPVYKKMEKGGFKMLSAIKKQIFGHSILSKYVMFSSAIGFSSLMLAWISLVFLYEAGLQDAKTGIIWTVLNATVALGSFSAVKMNRLWGNKMVLVFMFSFLSLGYLILSQSINLYGMVFLLILYYVRGTAHPILKERINRYTSTEMRATVLSMRSLLIRIMFFVFAPILGWLSENIGLSTALAMGSFTVFLPGLVLLYLLLKETSKTDNPTKKASN